MLQKYIFWPVIPRILFKVDENRNYVKLFAFHWQEIWKESNCFKYKIIKLIGHYEIDAIMQDPLICIFIRHTMYLPFSVSINGSYSLPVIWSESKWVITSEMIWEASSGEQQEATYPAARIAPSLFSNLAVCGNK